MAYNIWISLQARRVLDLLEDNEPEMYQQIQEMLDLIATEREGFITGAPLKNEVFSVGNWLVYYRVLHKLQGVDIVEIAQLP